MADVAMAVCRRGPHPHRFEEDEPDSDEEVDAGSILKTGGESDGKPKAKKRTKKRDGLIPIWKLRYAVMSYTVMAYM